MAFKLSNPKIFYTPAETRFRKSLLTSEASGVIMVKDSTHMPYVLLTYSIEHLAQKDKVLFYYALKGRDGKGGLLSNPGIIQMGRTVLLVPKKQEEEFVQFLEHWKCAYKEQDILIEQGQLPVEQVQWR
jgi:hypothetical protein